MMSKYYIPLEGLPEYCCECPCSTEGSVFDMSTGKEEAVYVWCTIMDTEVASCVASCNVTDLYPGWKAVPRPENCPIVHWLYISVGDCDDAAGR